MSHLCLFLTNRPVSRSVYNYEYYRTVCLYVLLFVYTYVGVLMVVIMALRYAVYKSHTA
jgi:hypothetical protein